MENNINIYLFMQIARVCESRWFTHEHDCNVARAYLFIHFYLFVELKIYIRLCSVHAAVASVQYNALLRLFFPTTKYLIHFDWVPVICQTLTIYEPNQNTIFNSTEIHCSATVLALVLGLVVDINSPYRSS